MADKKISALTAASTPLAGTEVLPIVQSGATVKVAVSDLTAGRAMAALSLTTATVQATNSGGLALKNSGGTTQMLLGGGGGDNITLSVATNITPANAAVAISPTGTGTLTLNPATASTINNMSIGATTALTGRFTDVTLTTGNLVVASGQGVDFSATPGTGTSELLNDYEEGTWTPSLAINSPGDLSVTYSTQTGYYTKVGRFVTVSFQLITSAFTHTTASGAWRIAGVPFLTSPNTLYVNGTIAAFQGITKANYTTFGSTTSTGSAQFLLYASGSAQGLDNVNAADIPSGGSVLLYGSFTYIV